MKIILTRDQIGRFLGFLLLLILFLGIPYLSMAWVTWELNPGDWSRGTRAIAEGLTVALVTIWFIPKTIRIAPAQIDEE